MSGSIEVLRALLKRKGKRVPIEDGRKIGLIVYGGAMSAVRSTGALTALSELGLTDAFDAIYTFSAGFPNAAYFLAKEASLSTKVYTSKLTGRRFINFFKPWRILNLEYMIEILEKRLILHPKRIWESSTKLYTCMYNCEKKKNELVEVHPHHESKEIFTLIKASCNLPFYAPGAVVYQGSPYKDMSHYEKEFLPLVLSQPMTDFLIIYNRPNQKPVNFHFSKNVFEIVPENDRLSWREIRGRILYGAARKMHNDILKIFAQV